MRVLTYANVTSTAALFIALGGVSYAAATLPSNSVGSKQLQANVVTSSKVKDGSLLRADFKIGELPTGVSGNRGPQGETGAQGDRGPQGERGVQGERGSQGLAGATGDVGATGLQGERGLSGVAGADGAPGLVGPAGPVNTYIARLVPPTTVRVTGQNRGNLVTTLSLPAGSYTLQATATGLLSTVGGLRCFLTDGNFDGPTMTGGDGSGLVGERHPSVGTAWFGTWAGPVSIELRCGTTNNDIYVSDTMLTATKVSSIQLQ
jgi:hypothetical protein